MRNNKGFTVVELIVTFGITMIIVVFLFQIILLLKETYTNNSVKTSLVIKQSIINQKIYDDFNTKEIVGFTSCGEECITFKFDDSSESVLSIDRTNGIFHYGDYTTKIDKGSEFGKITVTTETIPGVPNDKIDSIMLIKAPVTSKVIKGDYGINIVYQYNSRFSLIGTGGG